MSNVFMFPGKSPVTTGQGEQSAKKPYTEPPADKPADPPKPKAPVYMRIRLDALEAIFEALEFYGRSGFDHGERAKKVFNSTFN